MITNFNKQENNELCKTIYKWKFEDKTTKFELGETIPKVSITI